VIPRASRGKSLRDDIKQKRNLLDCAELLAEARQLLTVYDDPITFHALHVYHSALVGMPDCALQRASSARLRQIPVPRLITPRATYWPDELQFRHNQSVTFVAFSHDGRRVMSGASDGTAQIWDVFHRISLLSVDLKDQTALCVTVSTDGRRVASGSYDHAVRIREVQTGREDAKLLGHTADVCAIAFAFDGSRLVAGACDGDVRVWDVQTFQPIITLRGHTNEISCVAFSNGGTCVVSGSEDRTVRIWTVADVVQVAVFSRLSDGVTSVAFSPVDDERVVFSCRDELVRVGNASDPDQILQLENHTGWVQCVSFSQDGRYIVSGTDDQTVSIWDAVSGGHEEIFSFRSSDTGGIFAVAFAPDGRQVVVGCEDGSVHVRRLKTLQGHTHRGFVDCVVFSPDGHHVAAPCCSELGTACVWDAVGNRQPITLAGHTEEVCTVAFSVDGTMIATGSYDQTVRIWNVLDGSMHAVLTGHTDQVRSVAFSPSTVQLVVSSSDDETVRIWDVLDDGTSTGRVLFTDRASVRALCCSPNGQSVAFASKTVRIWNLYPNETEMGVLEGPTELVESLCYSPDGEHLVSYSDRTVRVWTREGSVRWESQSIATFTMSAFTSNAVRFLDNDTIYVPQHGAWRWRGETYYLHEPDKYSCCFTNGVQPSQVHCLLWDEDADEDGHWISLSTQMDTSVPLCWLPTNQANRTFAVHGDTIAIAGQTPPMTIIDCRAAVQLLLEAGV
jgi:WD40 repeat protein